MATAGGMKAKKVDESKIKALIALLDDPNEEVFEGVEQAMLLLPTDAVPTLEKAWEFSSDELLQNRLATIIHRIQFDDVKRELTRWKSTGALELIYGVYLVAKYQYPDLSFVIINEKVNAIRRDIWIEMHEHLTPLEKVRIVNHVLFDLYGFTRNSSNYISPSNNFINDVLETKKGNPLTLSVIYSILCQRLGLPVYGVNLPKNFILAYMDDSHSLQPDTDMNQVPVLFYINPINKGTVLGRKEIDSFLTQYHIQPSEKIYLPCSNVDMVSRLLGNLISAFDAADQQNKKKEIRELLKILEKES